MATRATYQIKSGYNTATFYIHWDGYLQGAAHYFKDAIELTKVSKRDFLSCFVWANKEATLTDGHEAHGDTEYRYNIERKNGSYEITAYKRVSYSRDDFEIVYFGGLDDFLNKYLNEQAA